MKSRSMPSYFRIVKPSIKLKVGLLCGLFIIILLVLGSLLLMGLSDVVGAFRSSVQISAKVIRDAQLLRQLVVDAVTGQRGFIITGKDEFLEPYQKANDQFKKIIKNLRKDLKDKPKHLQALREIEHLKWKWDGQAGEPEIRLRKRVGDSKIDLKQIDNLVREGPGKKILDRMRTVLARLEKDLRGANKSQELILTIELGRAIVDSETGQRGFMLAGKDSFLAPYYQGQIVFAEKYALLKALFQSNQAHLEKLTLLKSLYQEWLVKAAKPEIEARVQYDRNPRSIEDLADLLGKGKGKEIIDELRNRTNDFIAVLNNEVNHSLRVSEEKVDFIQTFGLFFMPACVILSLVLTYLLASSIVKSISSLLESTKILSTGDLSHRVDIRSNDEFALLGNAFNLMAEEIISIQDKLSEANKMASLGAMSSGIAHEINQPMGALLLKTQLVPKLIAKGQYDKIDELNESMMKQILRAKKIMDSLRIFSREDQSAEHEKCDINNIVEDVLPLFLEEFKLLRVKLEVMLTTQKAVIHVSPVQIGQVLSNLLTNARDAVENSNFKNVKIRTDRVKGQILLEVSDNGYGIPTGKIDRVFEPFFTTKPVGKGTGLGLSLSYSMIKDNGGDISVSSEEGRGTIFRLVFPQMKEIKDEKNYSAG